MSTSNITRWLFEQGNWQKTLFIVLVTITSFLSFSYLYDQRDSDMNDYGDDVWFQSDIPRIYSTMNNRLAFAHYRVKVHPLYSLETYPPTFVLKHIFSSYSIAIKYVTVCFATLWIFSLYALLRFIGCIKLDAVIFTLVGTSSSAALFMLSIPETYTLGSISIMAALSLAMIAQQKKISDWGFTAVSAFSLSVTVTNWMVGLLCTFTSVSFKRALKITALSLLAVIVLWGVQKLIFPTSLFFIGDSSEENKFMFIPTFDRLNLVFNSFFFHTTISPEFNVIGRNQYTWPMLSFQSSHIGSSGTLGLIASILWLLTLGLGLAVFFTTKLSKTFKITLCLTILGQFTLHYLYGEETFLYALHFLPLLIVLAASATLTKYRRASITLALILIPILFLNNLSQFNKVIAIAKPENRSGQNFDFSSPSKQTPATHSNDQVK